jgi:NAD+ synthase
MLLPHLQIDPAAETERITGWIRATIGRTLKRKGAVVAMSGGVDSSVCAALCVEALGADRVLGLFLPERDSSADTLPLSRCAAESLGIATETEDITTLLEAAGCYRRQAEAVGQIIPGFESHWQFKMVLPSVVSDDTYRVFSIVAEKPDGETVKARLTPEAYLGVVAATNFKQRTRKMLEYYHADRLNFAVVGTPNRLEYDQGFFVKLGDGAADLKPIAHLYKSQVYALAEHLQIPEEIRSRPPTTDTYSMEQGQDEFYFSLPYDRMDVCLYGRNEGLADEEVARAAGLTVEQLARVYRDIDQKRRTTRYLHRPPMLMEDVLSEGGDG